MARLDLFDPRVRENPYPHYAELRRDAPVCAVDPGGLWAVSRFADIVALFKDPAVYSSQGLRPMAVQPWLEHNPIADSLVMMDPPRHTSARALVTRAFGSRVVPRIEPIVRDIAATFAARVQGGAELDICDAFSVPLPAAVIANLLGFDRALIARFRDWTDDLVAISPATPADAHPRIRASIGEFERYVRDVLADRRRARRDDLVSDLIDAEVDGQKLTEDELVSFLFLLLVAGFETTAHLLTNALRLLAAYPALLERLRADPASIPAFVEEVLRFEPSVHGTARLALTDVEVAGVQLPAGSVLLLLLASANRDEAQFPDPDRFDIDRKQRSAIAFGHGIHFCLGAALARAEVRIALEELVPRIRGVHQVGEPTWNHSVTVRGATHCPMAFTPA